MGARAAIGLLQIGGIAIVFVMLAIRANSVEVVTARDDLLDMRREDQEIRRRLDELSREMSAQNTRHIAALHALVSRSGWPSVDQVGREANTAAFLVLQHAPLTEQKQLLPMFREAVSQGAASRAQLALLEDRVLVSEGKKQLYGTQIGGVGDIPRVHPVEDPLNLDVRRQAMGLPSMAQYIEKAEKEMGRRIDRSGLEVRVAESPVAALQ